MFWTKLFWRFTGGKELTKLLSKLTVDPDLVSKREHERMNLLADIECKLFGRRLDPEGSRGR